MNTQTVSNIARLLNFRAKASHLPPILYMTDVERIPDPRAEIAMLPPGSGVVFRHYDSEMKEHLSHDIKELCKKNELLFVIAGDISLAYELDADGLHLPEHLVQNPSLAVRLWRARPHKLLTAAAHSSKSLRLCSNIGVDAALVSPVFTTASHPGKSPLGILGFSNICNSSAVPVYALGGINRTNASRLLKSRAVGIAGISGIIDNRNS